MYKNKYLKYKNRYLTLLSQIGGECDPIPSKDDTDDFGDPLIDVDINPKDRITIDGKCHDIRKLYKYILSFPTYDVGGWFQEGTPMIVEATTPKMMYTTRAHVKPIDFEKIIQYYAINIGEPYITDEHKQILTRIVGSDDNNILRELITRARKKSLEEESKYQIRTDHSVQKTKRDIYQKVYDERKAFHISKELSDEDASIAARREADTAADTYLKSLPNTLVIDNELYYHYLTSNHLLKISTLSIERPIKIFYTIPNNINTIGNYAFDSVGLDSSFIIPDTIETIGNYAVSNNSLLSVKFPNNPNFKIISDHAFFKNQLTDLIIPDSVEAIGDHAFAKNQLISVKFPNNPNFKIISDHAFLQNQLTDLIIPDSLETIGDHAFAKNQLTSVKFPNNPNFKIISNSVFEENRLTDLIIPDTVETIGAIAFYDNQLTRLIIPDSVEGIGDHAFAKNQLTSVKFPNNENFKIIYDYAFKNNKLTELIIPESVKAIGIHAFKYNNLTELIIPKSVEYIGTDAFKYNNLTKVTIPIIFKDIIMEIFSNIDLITFIYLP